jgi:hypothetical protein
VVVVAVNGSVQYDNMDVLDVLRKGTKQHVDAFQSI